MGAKEKKKVTQLMEPTFSYSDWWKIPVNLNVGLYKRGDFWRLNKDHYYYWIYLELNICFFLYEIIFTGFY